MGGSNTKGLYLCETIYPPEDGKSCIPPEKLEKAIKKGEIPAKNPDDEEDLDEDEDEKIDKCIREVFNYYDPKLVGFWSKKQTQQFFKDALALIALRKNCKTKDLLPPGKNMDRVLEEAFTKLAAGGKEVRFEKFEEFINENDLADALSAITGNEEPIEIKKNVQLVDVSQLPSSSGPVKGQIQYRDYGALED